MTIEGDVLVTCTVSGAVYTLRKLVGDNPEHLATALRGLELDGVNMRFVNELCSDCRFTPSARIEPTKRTTCEYRPLRGPLFIPRATRSPLPQDVGSQTPHLSPEGARPVSGPPSGALDPGSGGEKDPPTSVPPCPYP